METIIVSIKACARCGEDHDQLEFAPLTKPVISVCGEKFSHWVICPKLGEPIMLSTERPPIYPNELC
jgi:hypothetical protein